MRDIPASPLSPPGEWGVLYEPAVRRLLAADPDSCVVGAIADWIERHRRKGPPDDRVMVWEEEELFLARIPRTDLVARYFVIVHERLIVIDHFEAE